VRTALFVGIERATVSIKLLFILLLGNLVCTVPVALPVFALVQQTAYDRVVAQRLLADQLDAAWLIDLVNNQFTGFSPASVGLQMGLLLLVAGALYLTANLFFTGGILTVFEGPVERFSLRKFCAGGGAYWWRFARLFLISLVFYGLWLGVYALVVQPLNAADARANAAQPIETKRWLLLLALVMGFGLINMVFDYARIRTVQHEARGMWRVTFAAWRFCLAYVVRTSLLYLLLTALGWLLFALFVWMRSTMPQHSWLSVMLAFGFGQMALVARLWTRLALFAGQADWHRQLAPAPALATPGVPVMEFMPATKDLIPPPGFTLEPGAVTLTPPVEPEPTAAAVETMETSTEIASTTIPVTMETSDEPGNRA
jgi:hypothetical protein